MRHPIMQQVPDFRQKTSGLHGGMPSPVQYTMQSPSGPWLGQLLQQKDGAAMCAALTEQFQLVGSRRTSGRTRSRMVQAAQAHGAFTVLIDGLQQQLSRRHPLLQLISPIAARRSFSQYNFMPIKNGTCAALN